MKKFLRQPGSIVVPHATFNFFLFSLARSSTTTVKTTTSVSSTEGNVEGNFGWPFVYQLLIHLEWYSNNDIFADVVYLTSESEVVVTVSSKIRTESLHYNLTPRWPRPGQGNSATVYLHNYLVEQKSQEENDDTEAAKTNQETVEAEVEFLASESSNSSSFATCSAVTLLFLALINWRHGWFFWLNGWWKSDWGT